MRAVVLRELLVIARRPALIIVTCLHVGLLAGFVLVWHRGIPAMSGANVYEQEQLFQWVLLAALLPWAAARCVAPERGDCMVLTCVLTALRPSSVVLGKVVALVCALAVIVMAGFPVSILAQQMSAVPLPGIVPDLLALLGLPVLVSAVTMMWVLAIPGRLASWVGASISTIVVLDLLFRWPGARLSIGLMVALVGSVVAAATAGWSDGALRYRADDDRGATHV